MRRLILGALLLWCLLIPVSVFADSVKIGFVPNDGSGDNFGFAIYGPGYFIAGGGGTPVDFFSDFFPGYAPGSTVGGSSGIFFDSGFARLGPNSSSVEFLDGTLFVSSISLPTNGQDFRAWVNVSFFASGILDSTGDPITASGGANGHIDFVFINGGYYPTGFAEAPEPGTLALIGTGLVAILARRKKRGVART